MQKALIDAGSTVQIYGVNESGLESSNDLITDGRDLPWLQDVVDTDLWTAWNVTYRDVILVDEAGQTVDVFNLTEQDLAQSDIYEQLFVKLQALDD